MQGYLLAFRANEVLVTALTERARNAGRSTSEYLRPIVPEKV